MKRLFGVALAACLAFSCASPPRARPQAAFFRPATARVRSALGLAPGQSPDARRMEEIGRAIWGLCREPHPVRDSLDLVFDRDFNGRIEREELRFARDYFYGEDLLRLNEIDPALARRLAAPPRVRLSREDLGIWREYLFVRPRQLLVPHFFANDFERKLAGEGARAFDERAIKTAIGLVSRAAAEAFLGTRPLMADKGTEIPLVIRGPVKNQLQAYANTSGSGVVSEEEALIADESLKGPHPVKTAFDRAIDFEGSGTITYADIEEARRAAFVPAVSAFSYVKGPFSVVTKADALLDIDGDGIVTEAELQADARGLAWGGGAPAVPPKLLETFDLNGDGKLEGDELRQALEFFRPHPVNPSNPLDAALDTQGRGFVSPDEIGIGAGQTAKGRTLSLDERVRALRLAAWKARGAQAASNGSETGPGGAAASPEAPAGASSQASYFTQRRIDISGKKLAVVGLTSATKNLSQDVLDGMTTFLENAFVNVGSVSIVDRSDIDKIMKELELQSSDAFASSDTAAVKVGKLSGADIIVTGTVSLVGKKYYLNVRLISVETGEVLASSIASADSPDGFLEMCQEAAAKMF